SWFPRWGPDLQEPERLADPAGSDKLSDSLVATDVVPAEFPQPLPRPRPVLDIETTARLSSVRIVDSSTAAFGSPREGSTMSSSRVGAGARLASRVKPTLLVLVALLLVVMTGAAMAQTDLEAEGKAQEVQVGLKAP